MGWPQPLCDTGTGRGGGGQGVGLATIDQFLYSGGSCFVVMATQVHRM